MIYELLFVMT